MALIIVESPTKARTFNRILKIQNKADQYFVYATMGHIRDLPSNKIAIDFEHQYKPDYQIDERKKKVVEQLKKLADQNDEIILATDLDREGESISYHVAVLLGLVKEQWPEIEIGGPGAKKHSVKRIVFHEITPKALMEALENPGELRLNLVKAQQGRRLLDRIVGYELSPLLWKKMGKNWLSAGRVQSVALRLIVEREKEITAFKQESYYQIYGMFLPQDAASQVRAKLIKFDDQDYEVKTKLALFDGDYTFTKTTISKENLDSLVADISSQTYRVSAVDESVVNRYPPPPHTTSLLQQDAFQRFGYSSKQTMRLAQNLYEQGLITYHRTDSFNLSSQFVFRAKDYIIATYGEQYALEKPRGFRNKSKSAQEAHEAIRPTRLDKTTDELFSEKSKSLTQNHRRLYQLIHDRAVATQMKEASVKQIKVYINSVSGASAQKGKGYEFEADYQQVLFDGFLKVLNPEFAKNNAAPITLSAETPMKPDSFSPEELMTKPPPRYNEATLIKTMEEKGIGRPSTYAPIISLIQDKYYVEKESRYFTPTKLGTAISDYLSTAFPNVFELNFTAQMEEGLDMIAEGQEGLIPLLDRFYNPFKKTLDERKDDKEVIDVEEDIDETCILCGSKLTVRFSRFGKFMACSNYPTCKYTKPFLTYLKGKNCPRCQGRMAVRYSRSRKRFYGCENYPKCTYSAWTIAEIGTDKPESEWEKAGEKKAVTKGKKVGKESAVRKKTTTKRKPAKKTVKK